MLKDLAIRAAVVLCYISAPASLGIFAWAMYLLFQQVPLWAVPILGLPFVIVALGLAALLDKRLGPLDSSRHGQ